MGEERKETILVVDDEKNTREALFYILTAASYQVETASDGAQALGILQRQSFDLVITDIKMPNETGIEILREAKKRAPYTQVMIITAYGEHEVYVQALDLGAYGFLHKPIRKMELLKAVREALNRGAREGGSWPRESPHPGEISIHLTG
ncbi:MAG: response regulator [Candidatus Tectomicrobia bacterium]|uniref:Response regulator n=1 Tax=Tectimicrobiota bacterium TaxID=2528274 RepID=A0A932CNA0_UNCTE|nr:response regulator [Candidatus Tectomicrobia bacterium]